MALESATYINGLVASNPTSSDNISDGDNHIRLIKSAIKATFPNVTGAVSGTHTAINSAVTTANTATTANSANSVVLRDASGNFSAGTVTAALAGNATTATTLQTARTISLSGDVSGSVSFNGSQNVDITAVVADDSHSHIVGNIDNFTEIVQDIAGAMFSGNSETGLSATYQDSDGTIDLELTLDPTIELTGDVTGSGTMTNLGSVSFVTTIADDSHNHIIANIDGLSAALDSKVDDSQVATNVPSNAVFTDTTYSAGSGLSLSGTQFSNSAPDQVVSLTGAGATSVTGSYPTFTITSTDTNTTYSVGDGGLTQKNFTTTLKSKLDGIEASADVTDTTNVVGALTAGSNISIASNGTISSTDTNTTYSVGNGGLTQNNFTDTLKSKLDAIESNATADQTATEIRTALLTVDGSGSGIDADQIDGKHIAVVSSMPGSPDANTIYFVT